MLYFQCAKRARTKHPIGRADFSYRAICCHIVIEKSDNRDVLFSVEQREHQRDFEFELDASIKARSLGTNSSA